QIFQAILILPAGHVLDHVALAEPETIGMDVLHWLDGLVLVVIAAWLHCQRRALCVTAHAYPQKSICSAPPAPPALSRPAAPAPAPPATGCCASRTTAPPCAEPPGAAPRSAASPLRSLPVHPQAGLPDCSQHAPQSAVPASCTSTAQAGPQRGQGRPAGGYVTLAHHIGWQRLRRLRQPCAPCHLSAHLPVGLGKLQPAGLGRQGQQAVPAAADR